ncbi:hypothetical protein HW423_06905 [Aerococcaceae bacterium INB8]|uniref:Uncharacterized protein n=1 Tax=Ruoffia halotolerans TaxID=2748684 RepID=A0A839A6I9_9LACT|nr:hypothetical protein [Ruoffia halotolerans]MBA5729511.1 hypothetical protein [Ruoffia halotolerans]
MSEMFDLGLFENKNYVGDQLVRDETTKKEAEEETEKHQELLIKDVKALNIEIIEDYKEADIVASFLNPVSGSYFDATPCLLELEICEEKKKRRILH